jgi:transporter family protein
MMFARTLVPEPRMKGIFSEWQTWAALSAVFAAATAVLGKIGVADIDSNFATLIRTFVVLLASAAIVGVTHSYQPLTTLAPRTTLFLALSGLATGASWLCYYRALKMGPAAGVASVDKMSVLLVAIFSVMFLGENLAGRQWIGVALIAAGTVLVAVRA